MEISSEAEENVFLVTQYLTHSVSCVQKLSQDQKGVATDSLVQDLSTI